MKIKYPVFCDECEHCSRQPGWDGYWGHYTYCCTRKAKIVHETYLSRTDTKWSGIKSCRANRKGKCHFYFPKIPKELKNAKRPLPAKN